MEETGADIFPGKVYGKRMARGMEETGAGGLRQLGRAVGRGGGEPARDVWFGCPPPACAHAPTWAYSRWGDQPMVGHHVALLHGVVQNDVSIASSFCLFQISFIRILM
jgi:hypothetical protein